jgi:hypothetical protein
VQLRRMLRNVPVLRALGPRRAGFLLGFLAVLVALLTLSPSYPGVRKPHQATAQQPSQLAVEVDVNSVLMRTAVYDDSAGTIKPTNVASSAIDVAVKNASRSTARITGANFLFRRIVKLERCTRAAGPVLVSAPYDVKVPTQPFRAEPPFVIRKDLRHELKGGAHERLSFKIGTESTPDGWPSLYQVDVSLSLDPATSVFAATVVFMEPSDYDWIFRSVAHGQALDKDCAERNAEALQDFVRAQGVRSPTLLSFSEKIQRLLAAER